VRERALYGILLLVGIPAILAPILVPLPHSGGDNAGYLELAWALAEGEGYRELWEPGAPEHTKYPPGFPLVLAGAILLGMTQWSSFKLLIAAITTAALLVTYLWASGRALGPRGGVAVALLTLFSAGWLDAARWILSEPLFLLLTFGSLGAIEAALRAKEGRGRPLMLLGWALAIGAVLTRSAGLPLLAAILASLLLRGRVRLAGLFLLASVPLLGGWALRLRQGGEGAYQSEFWMVNPYEPALGLVAWWELPARGLENLRFYLVEVLPAEWWGGVSLPLRIPLLLTVLLLLTAAVGWGVRGRRGELGPTELFLPLYLGLILLWPPVWAGSRFFLTLIPIVLLLAAEGGEWLLRRGGVPRRGRAVFATSALLLFLAPTLPAWSAMRSEGEVCRAAERAGDVFLCASAGFREYRDASAWMGAVLPPGEVVMTRKPRFVHLLGGPVGRPFPFTLDPEELLGEADRVGARYLLLDHLDGISRYYLPAILLARPLAFCHIRGWGGGAGVPGTDLFGILPVGERRVEGSVSDMRECTGDYLAAPGGVQGSRSGEGGAGAGVLRSEGVRVPLLVQPRGSP